MMYFMVLSLIIQMRKIAKFSPTILTKLNKNKHIFVEMLVRICEALDCGVRDILDVKNDNISLE